MILIDTSFFIALFDAEDEHHKQASSHESLLEIFPIIVPWPVMYETLRSRTVRIFHTYNDLATKFEQLVFSDNTYILDDSEYRVEASRLTLSSKNYRRKSFVDLVLHAIIEDTNVPIDYLFTFDLADFHEICASNNVEIVR